MENNMDPYFYKKLKKIFYNKWYKYNDSNVSEINKKDVLNYKPYCLFYKLVNL